jgi:hypothetical protein
MLVDLLYHGNTVNRTFVGANAATFAPIVILNVITLCVLAVDHIRAENVALTALGAFFLVGFRPHGSPIAGF